MSENITSASATALPNAFELGAAMIALKEARTAKAPLDALEEAHRQAWAACEEICGFSDYVSEDDPSYPILEAENDRRSDAEMAALTEVCAFPARTMDEARSKALFLLKYLRGGQLEIEHVSALLQSFIDAPAKSVATGGNAND